MSDVSGLLRLVTGASFLALCLVVGAVGAVGFVAELFQTWTWYFRMEQVVAMATPLALVLLGLAVTGAIGTVLSIRRA